MPRQIRYQKPKPIEAPELEEFLKESDSGRSNTRRSQVRPPRARTFPVLPTGPELYYQKKGEGLFGGPGEPPAGFLTFTNSRSEWFVYWALAKITGYPKDPRKPPFMGYPGLWTYQRPFEEGRQALGGQVVDFVVFGPATGRGDIALRIQTERYHIYTDAAKQASDRALAVRLGAGFEVVDLFEQDWISDPSGQAVVIATKRAIYGGGTAHPMRSGQVRRIRA